MARKIIATNIVEEFNHCDLIDILEFLIKDKSLQGINLVVANIVDKNNVIHQKPCVLMAYLSPMNTIQYLLYNKDNFMAHPGDWVLSNYMIKD